jgi:hypothetical protein
MQGTASRRNQRRPAREVFCFRESIVQAWQAPPPDHGTSLLQRPSHESASSQAYLRLDSVIPPYRVRQHNPEIGYRYSLAWLSSYRLGSLARRIATDDCCTDSSSGNEPLPSQRDERGDVRHVIHEKVSVHGSC